MEDLKAFGFEEGKVRQALAVCNNNFERALDWLLTASNDPPQTSETSNISTPSNSSTTTSELTILDISQYTFSDSGGTGACTSIALSALLTLLKRLDEGLPIDQEKETLTDAVFTGIQMYSTTKQQIATSVAHFTVNEVWETIPALQQDLNTTGDGLQSLLTTPTCFQDLFNQIKTLSALSETQYTGVILTKPPETILVIIPPNSTNQSSNSLHEKRWCLFDSHSRPQLGINGSYLMTASDPNVIIDHLKTLFPPLRDTGNAFEQDSIWTMMYNSIEANSFVRRKT